MLPEAKPEEAQPAIEPVAAPEPAAASPEPAAQEEAAVPYVPPVVDAQSVAYTEAGKVDESKMEMKDPLLEELNLPEENTSADDDFTWDIDDLK